jgi:hypothetical protein
MLTVNQSFGGPSRHQLQGRKISQERNKREASRKQSNSFLKRLLIFNGLYKILSQKTEPFITTAVRT